MSAAKAPRPPANMLTPHPGGRAVTEAYVGLTGGELIGLVAVVGGLLVPLAAVVAPFHCWTRRTQALAELKREMVAAGYTAADIERVLRAR